MLKSAKMRELLKSDRLIYVMGAHNGLSAKLVEKNNFDAIWSSGLEISTSYGVPDANILSMTQYLEKASEINEASSLPVISDCDTGYGNSNNVIYMVKKFESSGISAVCIEDKLFPKVNSFVPGRQELAPIAEFVGKIMAAKSAQGTSDFMVIARLEALIAGWGEEEALLRAEKYVDAGADALLIHSKSSDYDEIVSFARKWNNRAPLVIIPTKYPRIMKDLSEADLVKLGIKIVIFANQGIRAAIKASDAIMSNIRGTKGACLSDPEIKNQLVPIEEVFELQDMHQLKANEKKYLKSGTGNFNTIFLAAGSPKNQKDLEPLLRDRPVALLDINGMSLIHRNVLNLRQLGAEKVVIVTGYHGEQFSIEGCSLLDNPEYENKNSLYSFMLAQQELQGKTILAFGDILFDKNIIEKLLKSGGDIVLVVDATFKKLNIRNKKLDLVVTSIPPQTGHRSMENYRLKKIVKIGDDISEPESHYEFVGLAQFSEKGADLFKDVYNELKKGSGKAKRGKLLDSLTINDVLQEIINRGIVVSALEVNSGWMEIHNFENYKSACSLFSREAY